MKRHITYIFASLLLLILHSCEKEELGSSLEKEGAIEFVARTTRYNKLEVSTKAAPDPIEDVVYASYFLLFDNNGNLVKYQDMGTNSSIRIKPDAGLKTATACIIANVPEGDISSIRTLSDLESLFLTIDKYTEYAPEGGNQRIGVPSIKLNTNGTEIEKQCLPMMGLRTVKLSDRTGNATPIEIDLERLFAKAVINLKMNIAAGEGETAPTFTLEKFTLFNLPKKLAIAKARDDNGNITQSAWATITSTAEKTSYFANNIKKEGLNFSVPNTTGEEYLTFICYTPEYAVLPISDAVENYKNVDNNQVYKPMLVKNNEGEHVSSPLYIELEGAFTGTNNTRLINYSVYLGENNFDSFSLFRNTQYNNYLTITGTSNNIDNKLDFRVSSSDMPRILVNEYQEAANCYIISQSGTYQLDCYEGATKNLNSNKITGKPEFIWHDADAAAQIEILEKDKEREYIRFKVTGTGSNGNIKPSNAVIAIKKDGVIQWSWHLWLCVDNDRPDLESKRQTYPDVSESYEMMNRNLGAISDEGINLNDLTSLGINLGNYSTYWKEGMYYQWGRKDPFRLSLTYNESNILTSATYNFEKKALGGSLETAIKNPNVFDTNWNKASTWTNSNKSTHDPCPPGYKVPSQSVWSTSRESSIYATSNAFLYALSPLIAYSYSSGLDNSGNIITPQKTEVTNGLYQDPNSNSFSKRIKIRYNSRKYRNFGTLWTNNATFMINYYNDIIDYFSATSIDINIGLFSENWKTINLDEISNNTYVKTLLRILGSSVEKLNEYVADMLTVLQTGDRKITNITPTGYGASQVRCVKETSNQ